MFVSSSSSSSWSWSSVQSSESYKTGDLAERERGNRGEESKVAEEVPAPKADNYTHRIGFSAWSLSLM